MIQTQEKGIEKTKLPCPEDKKVLTVNDLTKILGLSLASCYALTRSKGFPAFKVGKKVLIPTEAFDRWLNTTALGQSYESYNPHNLK